MEQFKQLKFKYNGGVNTLLIVIMLTVINCLIPLAGGDFYFLFSAFFPYFAVSQLGDVFIGMPQVIYTAVSVVLPIAALLICWLLARKEKYGWLTAALILLIADTLFMAYIIFTYKLSVGSVIVNLIVRVFVLLSLIRGAAAGTRLSRGDYAPVEGILPAAEENAEDEQPVTPRKYYYDKLYAKRNNAVKDGKAVLRVVLMFVLAAAALALTAFLGKLLGTTAGLFGLLGGVLGATAIATLATKGVDDFQSAEFYYYHVRKKGVLEREGVSGKSVMHLEMRNIKLLETKPDCWVIEFDMYGGRSRLTIPNAYPGLEEFMNELAE